MTNPPVGSVASTGGRWLYPSLLASQTIGAFIVLWNGVPLYQQLTSDPSTYHARPETVVWALSASALIQIAYWTSYRVRAALPRIQNAFLGHVVRFVARMMFVLANSIFAFVFLTQKLASQIPAWRYGIILITLFSLFCYMLELLRLGNAIESFKQASES